MYQELNSDDDDDDNAILIQNVDSENLDPILLYFENSKKSGGGRILKKNYQDGNLIIYYESKNTVKNVLNFGDVKIGKQTLRAKKYEKNSNLR